MLWAVLPSSVRGSSVPRHDIALRIHSRHYTANFGFSIGINDVTPGPLLTREKQRLVTEAYAKCQDLIEKASTGDGVARIPVVPGETIGISVDPSVADVGWSPVIGQQDSSRTRGRTIFDMLISGFALLSAAPCPIEMAETHSRAQ